MAEIFIFQENGHSDIYFPYEIFVAHLLFQQGRKILLLKRNMCFPAHCFHLSLPSKLFSADTLLVYTW